ncbi:calcineurin subunit B isoform X2 [Exaiptasia diaphana]|uniref:EF-hand domain-containing protein n=1 Tax=Exaiptasia diaphana TaxID=2652724 RepID=A0A913WQH4_EXADI|nr:calcineurin subunit B isoform X2 [Exaiptasia diaphana]
MQRALVTSKEIIRILKRYSYYDPNNTQQISLEAFLELPEVSANRIMKKIGKKFVDPETQCLTPSDFVKLFSALSSRTPLKDKKEFAFKVLDTDDNGYLSYDELFSFYRMLFGPALSDDRLLDIVMTTINDNSSSKQGLTYEDFLKQRP